MKNKPTLGGLKKMQEFLKERGFPLPFFQTSIYDCLRKTPGKTVSLDEVIREHGPYYEVTDVRLASHEADPEQSCWRFVQFIYPGNYGPMHLMEALDRGISVLVEFSQDPSDEPFVQFMKSEADQLLNLARWGLERPTFVEKAKFRWFRDSYAKQIFCNPG